MEELQEAHEVEEAVEGGPPKEACLGALDRIWQKTQWEFVFEEISLDTLMLAGDVIVTVIFHTRETREEIEVLQTTSDGQVSLCVSFLLAVVEKDEQRTIKPPPDLLNWGEEELKEPVEEEEPEVIERKLVFELFGSGLGDEYTWRFLSQADDHALDTLNVLSTASFRHRYVDPLKAAYDREAAVERSRLILDPFPVELVENIDLLVNCILLGMVPITVPVALRDQFQVAGLMKGEVSQKQMEKHRQKLQMTLSVCRSTAKQAAKHAHKLVRVGHVGILIESGIVLAGAAYDSVYDRKNLVSNVKRRGKLGAASGVGGAIGTALGLAVPIPGFFFVTAVAGSVTARWIASQYVGDGNDAGDSEEEEEGEGENEGDEEKRKLEEELRELDEEMEDLDEMLETRPLPPSMHPSEVLPELALLEIEEEVVLEEKQEKEKEGGGDLLLLMDNSSSSSSSSGGGGDLLQFDATPPQTDDLIRF
jgi:hypothetical protein